MNIIYKENALKADDVLLIQKKMNWTVDPKNQWEKSLKNTYYSVAAVKGSEIIGMGRLIGDGAIYWYINDVYILTEYQQKGIGSDSEIVKRLVDFAKKEGIPGTEISICLMCAKGKEGFYEKFGFHKRPHEYEGAGMEMEVSL